MHGIRGAHGVLRVALLLVLSAAPVRAADVEEFPLEEASVFEAVTADGTADVQTMTYRYQAADRRSVWCESAPQAGVVYPKLQSRAPWYGAVPLSEVATDQTPFVLDESEPVEESTAGSGPSLMRQVADLLSGAQPAVPEVKNKYDVLYLDINGDRDLTNDPPLRPIKDPPQFLVNMVANRSLVVFDYLEIKRKGEHASEAKPVRFLPAFTVHRQKQVPGFPGTGGRQANVVMTPTTVRTARIRIDDTWYQAVLRRPGFGEASWLLVTPETAEHSQAGRPQMWLPMPLGRYQTNSGFYDIAASPTGDKITVGPYTGPMGEFRVDLGERKVERFGAVGSLQTAGASPVWMGEPGNNFPTEWPSSCKLPEGDYRLAYLTLACGDLQVSLSPNPRRTQMPNDPSARTAAFPIAIRADQPVVMRLGEQPTVTFVSPSPEANQVFRRGQPIVIRGMLLDPSLDCIIRGLNDMSRKVQERTYATPTGETRTAPVYASLVPQVSITNSAGKEVASGPMPFG